jgi:hypothetical protein
MTRGSSVAGGDDLRRRVVTFIRKSFPFAYCDACLALWCSVSLTDVTTVMAELTRDESDVLLRTRRAGHGCARTLEITALRDGQPSQ